MIALSELKGSGGIFDYDSRKERLEEILLRLEDPSLWNNPEEAQRLGQERARLEETVEQLDGLARTFSDLLDLLELARLENDDETIEEIAKESEGAKQKLEKLEFRRMFSGEADEASAFVDIQAGSGGTEAQDWAEMLLRMYLRWSESGRYSVELVEKSEGEVAGIKSATIHVSGEYAYGYLRTETGVHRLVRKSPFDSGNRRHTSFASVFVYPEVDDRFEVEINPADLRIDTYRASGAGGQHVNKTDSAVRITHIPTHIVVQCQSGRSQHKNKSNAMAMLKSRLYELELQKRKEEENKKHSEKKDIGWGNQIRSYVLHPYKLIKDLRTNHESSNVNDILNGDIDKFLEKSLTLK